MGDQPPFIFDPNKADQLLDPIRQVKLPPGPILDLLGIQLGDSVADLGCGNGYFTVPIAKRTGNTVYAVDIEPKMLERLMSHADRESVTNINAVQATMADTTLEPRCINKWFSAFVMHEVPDLHDVMNEMRRLLVDGGKALVVDWEAVESHFGPPLHVRIPSETLKMAFEEKGFKVEHHRINSNVYALLIQF